MFAAPASGSGKTTITLGFLRAAARSGVSITSAKSGPDYIDPRFHAAASGSDCVNLDAWAMTPDRIRSLVARSGNSALVVEGAMGLFDGAPPNGNGSCADLARILGIPVVLVIDCGRMAGSVAAIARGFAMHDPTIKVAGVVLNNVGSARHETMLRDALAPFEIHVFGVVIRSKRLAHPSRHLGLQQANERPDLDAFLDHAADVMDASLDMAALVDLASGASDTAGPFPMTPPAQNIAVAQDVAFGFAYPHILRDWKSMGAQVIPFSPLANEAVPAAEFVYLPGGYPELYAGQLASNSIFMRSIQKASEASDIYGECGGYMTLGDAMIDADGITHKMAGLLSVTTSFATRKLHLGYRDILAASGPFAGAWKAHEFHYASTIAANGDPLFKAQDATGAQLPDMGLINGRVSGSFAHIIDQA